MFTLEALLTNDILLPACKRISAPVQHRAAAPGVQSLDPRYHRLGSFIHSGSSISSECFACEALT